MLPNLFDGTTIPVLEEVLSFSQARHGVLAGNVANADTPGYRVRDLSVETFQERLKEAIAVRAAHKEPLSPGLSHSDPGDAMRQVRESSRSILFLRLRPHRLLPVRPTLQQRRHLLALKRLALKRLALKRLALAHRKRALKRVATSRKRASCPLLHRALGRVKTCTVKKCIVKKCIVKAYLVNRRSRKPLPTNRHHRFPMQTRN